VTQAQAVGDLVAVAERLGAPVFSEQGTMHGRVPFPTDHPLYNCALPLWSPEVRQRLAEFDVLLVAGMNLLCNYIYMEPARPLPEKLRIVQLDNDAWQIGKNYPVEVGLLGDLQSGLAELNQTLTEAMGSAQVTAARSRLERHKTARQTSQAAIRERGMKERDVRPMTPLTLMSAVARVLPPDAAVVEEAVTTTNGMLERLGALRDPSGYFGHRGWALGWGLGCAVGVKLAWPDRPVLALLGDGSALYGIQGLWSAAHHQIPVTFIICNNAQYLILKHCGDVMPLPRMKAKRYLGMDLTDPEIDFVALAQSLGVEACRITDPDELSERLRASLVSDRPRLFDVVISR
jgi:benzoylformate decarboxylase